MCGIFGGFWKQAPKDLSSRLANSLNQLKHRGPDDDDIRVYNLDKGTLVLGHARLSIIDLTSSGRQPMSYGNGKLTIVFNGEIYNYQELRVELEAKGHLFRTNTDTEVLVASWLEWGQECLNKLEGMFVFVMYDHQEKILSCSRDAFGIKPFFYYYDCKKFLFASEIPALLALLDRLPEPNLQRCYDYLVHGIYDHDDNTFFKKIKTLSPAHYLKYKLESNQISQLDCWWQPTSAIKTSKISFDDAVEKVRYQFLKNVRLHLRSDVKLGVALSGGIDSSAVACSMRYIEPDSDIHTFSFIAKGSLVSEENWIDIVNRHIDAIPHQVVATSEDLLNDLDSMITAQGEPFGSTSIYAQYRVFKLAKEAGVTVILDGQGADELLAGYIGYPGYRLLSLLENHELNKALSFSLHWGKWPNRTALQAWLWLGRILLPDALYGVARKFSGRNFEPKWLNTKILREHGVIFKEYRPRLNHVFKGRRVIEQLQHSLKNRGLPALLRHADRNSMRFSIESRVPFLTLPLANLLLSLPENYLISDYGETKYIFREAMRGIVPHNILNRKDKIGFATPETSWIRQKKRKWRQLLADSENIEFINTNALIREYDKLIYNSSLLQVWRWINFVKWYNKYYSG